MAEHVLAGFLVELRLERVAGLDRLGAGGGGPGIDLVEQALEVGQRFPGTFAKDEGNR